MTHFWQSVCSPMAKMFKQDGLRLGPALNHYTTDVRTFFPSQPPPPPLHSHRFLNVPAGSPSRGGDVTVYVIDKNQQRLPTPFYSVLASIFVFMALSTVFHSINSLATTRRFLILFFRSYPFLIHPFNYMSLDESLLQS